MLSLVCIIPAGRSRTAISLGFPVALPVLSHRYPCKNMRCLPTITAAVSPCLPGSVYSAYPAAVSGISIQVARLPTTLQLPPSWK
nr:MAG TPA: hypothetical protein [Caudoviricetes sp.]